MAKREVKQWITVNGVHIPIFEGQSKEEAVKAALEKKKSAGPISKATRGKKIAEHTKKATEYASAIVKRELAEKNYKNARKSGSEDRIRTMDRALDYAKDKEKQKYREVAKAYNRADEAREKKAYDEVKFGKKNTFENRKKLKDQIDAYVKAHPNPNAEDRKKVSEMRDRYNVMLKESTAKTKAKVNAQLAEERKQEAKKKELEELKREHYKLYKHDEDNIPGRDEKLNELENKIRELEKKSTPNAEKSTSQSVPASKGSTPEFKNRQEAEEYYKNKFAGVSSTYANKMAKKLGVEGRGKDKREALAKAYADKWETSQNISNNDAEKEKQIARNAAERQQAEQSKDFITHVSDGHEVQIPRKTIEARLKQAEEHKQALYDMANRPNSRYKLNPNDLRKADEDINKYKSQLQGNDSITKDSTEFSSRDFDNYAKGTKVQIENETWTKTGNDTWKNSQGDKLTNRDMYDNNIDGNMKGDLDVTVTPPSKKSGVTKVGETSNPEKAISTLNDLKKQAWQPSKDKGYADKIRDEIKRIGEELPDGTVLARVNQNTRTQYTSQGAVQSQNTEISKLYKINGKWSKYKDGSGETDFAREIVYNSGELQTLEQAEKRAAELKKGDYIQTKGYGVKEKWQPTNDERNAAIMAERAGGLSLEDATRKVDRMSPEQVRKLAGSQNKQSAPKQQDDANKIMGREIPKYKKDEKQYIKDLHADIHAAKPGTTLEFDAEDAYGNPIHFKYKKTDKESVWGSYVWDVEERRPIKGAGVGVTTNTALGGKDFAELIAIRKKQDAEYRNKKKK